MIAGAMVALANFSCSGGASGTSANAQPAQSSIPEVQVPTFSADSAYSNVKQQVEFGPRVPGSAAHRACADWLIGELKRHGADTVTVQEGELPKIGRIRNIMGRFGTDNSSRILLLAHYDTRPVADEDSDPANRQKPIDGANDGASGVGVLLEIARLAGNQTLPVGVDILFVDAEDSGDSGDDDSWAQGTQYFVKNMTYGASEPMPQAAVLLDMVGGKDAMFHREMFSQHNAPALVNEIWSAAKSAGHADRFPNSTGGAVNDDHLPLLRAGIPAVDIIETNNPVTGSFAPTWHTLADNIDNIDINSLKAVGETMTTFIFTNKK